MRIKSLRGVIGDKFCIKTPIEEESKPVNIPTITFDEFTDSGNLYFIKLESKVHIELAMMF